MTNLRRWLLAGIVLLCSVAACGRDFQPGTGRYIEADPIGLAGGTNRYSYAEADAINGIDPEGLSKRTAQGPVSTAQQQINFTANILQTQIRELRPNYSYNIVSQPGQGGYTRNDLRAMQQTLLELRQQAVPAPTYVVSQSGMCMAVPAGSALVPNINPAGNITGAVFTGGTGGGVGLSPQVTQLRLMDATGRYSNGYATYMNAQRQGVDPFSGNTLPLDAAMRHIPF